MTKPAIKIKAAKKPVHVHINMIEVPRSHDYTGPVVAYGTAGWNPDAHGADCITEVCSCCAVRFINVSGVETEAGKWRVDLPCASYHLQLQAAQKLRDAAEGLASAVEDSADTEAERGTLAVVLAELEAAMKPIAKPAKRARKAEVATM